MLWLSVFRESPLIAAAQAVGAAAASLLVTWLAHRRPSWWTPRRAYERAAPYLLHSRGACDALAGPRVQWLRNDAVIRDMVSCGLVAGVAVGYSAPIGGLLLAMEEGSTHWLVGALLPVPCDVNVTVSCAGRSH